jgi:hypothetical protein
MKRLIVLMMVFTSAASVNAQTQIAPYPQVPAAFNYQGVARNATGQPLANQSIRVYSSIITPATPVFGLGRFYIEKRTVTTNAFGLFSIQIGSPGADSTGGSFPGIGIFQAYGHIMHLHTDIVLPNTTALISLGDTKMAAVPFSLYAKGARPWSYTISEETPGAQNFTIYPDKNYWNLGLGTAEATEKLHVVGRIRMVDGAQANGAVMTSDANGVASWKPNAVSPWTRSGNKTFLINGNDSVGIGVGINTSAKLDVFGKLRLRDGTEFLGYNLVSDQQGYASWKKPDWTVVDNNIGAGFHGIYPTDFNRTVGIGTSILNPFVKLHVNGGLRFEGNGPLVEGNVLTVGFGGNAVWQNPAQNANTYWVSGNFNGANIETKPTLANTPYYSNSQFIINKDMNVNATNDYLNVQNYPMQVQNSKHGMAIVVNGAAQKSKKFISFFDNGFARRFRGAIEGQTLLELQNDPEYIAYIVIQTLSTGSFLAEGIACGFQADVFEVIVQVIQLGIWGADLGVTIDRMEANVGVNYSSGSADYAEWLEKADLKEKFYFGDIVSVNGGKISKKITGNGQLMVISRAPIVLGNVPDEERKADYEKVAFMGQVPVKVKGNVAIGDYIVAIPNGNGIGYAVNPNKITTEEMSRIAGVAWSASGDGEFSMINTAVGLNTQASNQFIKKQDEEINLLKNTVNQLSSYLQSKDSSFQYTKIETKPVISDKQVKPSVVENKVAVTEPSAVFTSFSKLSPEEQLKRLNKVSIEKVKDLINNRTLYLDAVMKFMKEKMEASGVDLNGKPEFKRLFTDRAFMIEQVKKIYGIQ